MALRPAPVESTPKSDSSSLFVWLIAVLCFILVAIFAATLHNYRWYSKELVDSDEEESEYLVKCSVCSHASSVSAEEVLIEMVPVSKIGTFCFCQFAHRSYSIDFKEVQSMDITLSSSISELVEVNGAVFGVIDS